MNVEDEIYRLRGESIALQTVSTLIFAGLVELGEPFKSIVAQAFDQADAVVESGAFKLGGQASEIHLSTFADVLEQLRNIALGSQGEPKHTV